MSSRLSIKTMVAALFTFHGRQNTPANVAYMGEDLVLGEHANQPIIWCVVVIDVRERHCIHGFGYRLVIVD